MANMHAMTLEATGARLARRVVPRPEFGPTQVLLRVCACAVCRTDLHVVDGELTHPKLPLVPGHEVVGVVEAMGKDASRFNQGDRIGIPWLGWTCGTCFHCRSGHENLCEKARFTGYTLDGGYADYMAADERYGFLIPERYSSANAAPLLCAGLIGYRCLVKAGDGKRVGLYGFGAAAHIVCQVLTHQGREVYAFTRPGDAKAQEFARSLGAVWAGDSTMLPPEQLDAAIIFASQGALVPQALRATRPGGTVVCGGIHMSDIPSFPYELLWRERTLCSVANLTRKDGEEFMALATRLPIQTSIHSYPLEDANRALDDLRNGRLEGAAVLVPGSQA